MQDKQGAVDVDGLWESLDSYRRTRAYSLDWQGAGRGMDVLAGLEVADMRACVWGLAQVVPGLGDEFRNMQEWLTALSRVQMETALRTVLHWALCDESAEGIKSLPALLRSTVNRGQPIFDATEDDLDALPFVMRQVFGEVA